MSEEKFSDIISAMTCLPVTMFYFKILPCVEAIVLQYLMYWHKDIKNKFLINLKSPIENIAKEVGLTVKEFDEVKENLVVKGVLKKQKPNVYLIDFNKITELKKNIK